MTDFDDTLLNTTEDLSNIDYDQLEGYGLVSEGRHLVEIERVAGYMHNFQHYTAPRAKLKMRVVGGTDIGKYIYDDINLPHRDEKQGNQNRRVLIATRLGLVAKGTKETKAVNWKLLEGKQAVVTVVHTESEKDGKKRTFANVEFSGYEGPESWNMNPGGNGNTPKETWSDI